MEAYIDDWKRVRIFDNRNFCCFRDDGDGKPSVIDYRISPNNMGSVEIMHLSGPMPMMDVIISIIETDRDFRKVAKTYIEETSPYKFLYNVNLNTGMTGHEYYNIEKWAVAGHLEKSVSTLEATSNGKYDFQANDISIPVWAIITLILWYTNNDGNCDKSWMLVAGERHCRLNLDSVFKTYNKKVVKAVLRKHGVRLKYLPGYHKLEREYRQKSGTMFTL